MIKKDIVESIEELENNIGLWKVELAQLTDADFVMGYGFDEAKGQWKVFQNSERGMHLEWLVLCQEKVQVKNDFFPSCQFN